MAAEIRVDTIKSRAGINTIFSGSDGLSLGPNVGIGTTVIANPVVISNTGKLSVGIVTSNDAYSVNIINTGIATFSGTSHMQVPAGTTGQRPGSATAGDFRYNTTDGKFEGYTDAWGAIGGGAEESDTSVSATTATAIYTVAHATYRSASLIVQITQGSAYQTGRYLVIHDGTTATIVEEAAVATGSMLGTLTASIVSSNLIVYVNMGSSSSATVTVIPTPVTV